MISRTDLGLPLLACALLLLLALEWLLPGTTAPAWQPPPVSLDATAENSTSADPQQWAHIILARPLLSQTRRPPPPLGPGTPEMLPRLSAIIVIGGIRRAIFDTPGEKPQLVAEGDVIGIYRIETVAPDRVDVAGPAGTVVLKPQFLTAPTGGPTPAPPPQ